MFDKCVFHILFKTIAYRTGTEISQLWPLLHVCYCFKREYHTTLLTEAHSPLCRTHATLLAGDAWGRVFTWTCEWEVAGFERNHTSGHHFYTPSILSERLWHRKSISVSGLTPAEHWYTLCVSSGHSGRTMLQYLVHSSLRRNVMFYLLHRYLIMNVSL